MMAERRTLSSWFHWSTWFTGRTQRETDRRKAEDCADYGTAFGLDMSMEPQQKSASAPRPATQPTPAKAPTERR